MNDVLETGTQLTNSLVVDMAARQEAWIVPIPGTTKLSRLEENIGGATIELTTEDVRALEEATSAIHIEGERYPATHAKLIDR
jgi:aryl-alcohol dehydrogenase-like predicted oxidoreductase